MVTRMSITHVDRLSRNVVLDEDAHCEHFQLIGWERVAAVGGDRYDTTRRDGCVNLVDVVDLTLDHLCLR